MVHTPCNPFTQDFNGQNMMNKIQEFVFFYHLLDQQSSFSLLFIGQTFPISPCFKPSRPLSIKVPRRALQRGWWSTQRCRRSWRTRRVRGRPPAFLELIFLDMIFGCDGDMIGMGWFMGWLLRIFGNRGIHVEQLYVTIYRYGRDDWKFDEKPFQNEPSRVENSTTQSCPSAGRRSSMVAMSLRQRFRARPVGVRSKKRSWV